MRHVVNMAITNYSDDAYMLKFYLLKLNGITGVTYEVSDYNEIIAHVPGSNRSCYYSPFRFKNKKVQVINLEWH